MQLDHITHAVVALGYRSGNPHIVRVVGLYLHLDGVAHAMSAGVVFYGLRPVGGLVSDKPTRGARVSQSEKALFERWSLSAATC